MANIQDGIGNKATIHIRWQCKQIPVYNTGNNSHDAASDTVYADKRLAKGKQKAKPIDKSNIEDTRRDIL